jgi:hypothetical protein
MIRPTRTVLATLAAAGVAFALVSAPAAQADELSFLQGLNANGIVVYDTTAVLSNGYLACDMMNTKTGDVVATELLYRFPAEATISSAATLVIVAAQELCPWHWHPAGVAPGRATSTAAAEGVISTSGVSVAADTAAAHEQRS